MRTEPSTENPPPCCHCPIIARASSRGSRPRRTKTRNSRWRTCACTWAMAVASTPVSAVKMTPPAAATSNTPSMTTQWKCRWALRRPRGACSGSSGRRATDLGIGAPEAALLNRQTNVALNDILERLPRADKIASPGLHHHRRRSRVGKIHLIGNEIRACVHEGDDVAGGNAWKALPTQQYVAGMAERT